MPLLRKAALSAAFAVLSIAPLLGAAPAVNPLVASGALPGGGRYVVRRSETAPVAAVALWYRAPASGFSGAGTPGLARLAAATVAASIPITGTPVGRFVDEMGGRIAISTYPDSIAISALVPAERAGDVVRAMTASFFAPVISEAGLRIAQRDVTEEALVRQFNPEDYIADALTGALFSDGPARYPSLGEPSDVRKIPFDRVKSFAERAFRPANAVLVVTGAVEERVVSAAVTGRSGAAVAPEPPSLEHAVAQPAPVNTTGTERGTGLGWIGPAIADEREATALDFLADYLFRADTGIVQRAIASTKATVTGKFVTYHDPGVVLITISGGDVDAARTIVDAALTAARKPLDPATFSAARDAFAYHMLSDIQTPGQLADTFGWYTVEGNPSYAPGADGARYFNLMQALTPQFVAATVGKYLSRPGATVAVTAKKGEPPR